VSIFDEIEVFQENHISSCIDGVKRQSSLFTHSHFEDISNKIDTPVQQKSFTLTPRIMESPSSNVQTATPKSSQKAFSKVYNDLNLEETLNEDDRNKTMSNFGKYQEKLPASKLNSSVAVQEESFNLNQEQVRDERIRLPDHSKGGVSIFDEKEVFQENHISSCIDGVKRQSNHFTHSHLEVEDNSIKVDTPEQQKSFALTSRMMAGPSKIPTLEDKNSTMSYFKELYVHISSLEQRQTEFIAIVKAEFETLSSKLDKILDEKTHMVAENQKLNNKLAKYEMQIDTFDELEQNYRDEMDEMKKQLLYMKLKSKMISFNEACTQLGSCPPEFLEFDHETK